MNKNEILNRIEAIEKEASNLKEQLEKCDDEPKLERKLGRKYYTIHIFTDIGIVNTDFALESNDYRDNSRYSHNNYFLTQERATQVADKINFLLKLERLHDIYCPDYEPDFDNEDEQKLYIYYNIPTKTYHVGSSYGMVNRAYVYFPTLDIAQKVCDILNEEVKNNER